MRRLLFRQLSSDDIETLMKLDDRRIRPDPWDALRREELSGTEQRIVEYVTTDLRQFEPTRSPAVPQGHARGRLAVRGAERGPGAALALSRFHRVRQEEARRPATQASYVFVKEECAPEMAVERT